MLTGDEQADHAPGSRRESFNYSYDYLKELDPVAANRLHPNNQRKVGIPTCCFCAVLEKCIEIAIFVVTLFRRLNCCATMDIFCYSVYSIFFLPR